MFLLPVIDEDETENRFWNASLDGRAIHSFLLWVEPHSNAWARRADTPGGGAAGVPDGGTPDALGRALVGMAGDPAVGLAPESASAALLPLDDGPRVAVLDCAAEDGVLRLRPSGPDGREAVTDAARVLRGVGLRYVIDLAVGAIVLGDVSGTAALAGVCDVARLSVPEPDADPVALAEELLREGARSWMAQWLRTEETVGVRSAPLPGTDRDWLSGILADCFAFQLHDRLAARRPQGTAAHSARRGQEIYDRLRAVRDELPGRVGATVGMGIVAELVATSYPCWNRRQFAVKSPFDYIREIRPLTDAEKTEHLTRWATPLAVR
ncbi:hypothetical protein QQY24_06295 [Streptomyces sp. TG1A-8]|uniref:hypothetical protein n=1 Tax=Streptomyces sp. TG1A-8 TaxID=3051385 RepID=UPI00265B8BC2|nr:hypothetical protein [Streptomyces sp. TG1A-8]MDO0925046.1 hypothetical protein [Streptomyces sp. TG1A-8]